MSNSDNSLPSNSNESNAAIRRRNERRFHRQTALIDPRHPNYWRQEVISMDVNRLRDLYMERPYNHVLIERLRGRIPDKRIQEFNNEETDRQRSMRRVNNTPRAGGGTRKNRKSKKSRKQRKTKRRN